VNAGAKAQACLERWTSGAADEPRELDGVDLDLECLHAVDGHDGDAHAVLELEGVVAVDVDLLQLEGRAEALGLEGLPGPVAQAAAGAC
jgi:hypothetical protein